MFMEFYRTLNRDVFESYLARGQGHDDQAQHGQGLVDKFGLLQGLVHSPCLRHLQDDV